mmetsp:Transcript_19502/g.59031  ORF Transcript_19502/g.59031 Transcript_19502/m.59031 type:complete len:307 (-) Transcript_19502:236-1156(-)
MDERRRRPRARAPRARGRHAHARAVQLPAERNVRDDDAGPPHGQPGHLEAAGHRRARPRADDRRAAEDAAARRRQLCVRQRPSDAADRHVGRPRGLSRLHRRLEGRRRAHQAAPAAAPAQGLLAARREEPRHRLPRRGPRRRREADRARVAVLQRPALHGHQIGRRARVHRENARGQIGRSHRGAAAGPALGRERVDHAVTGAEQARVLGRIGRGRDREGRVGRQRPRRRHGGPALSPGVALSRHGGDARVSRGAVWARGARGRVRGPRVGHRRFKEVVERPAGRHLHPRRGGRGAARRRVIDDCW